MRINIVDPCLRRLGGHFFDHDVHIAGLLAGEGHDVRLYGHEDADPGIARLVPPGVFYAPIFRADPYDGTRRPWFPVGRQLQAYFYQARVTAADLRTATKPADLWIWPTMFASFLRASASIAPHTAISGVVHHALDTHGKRFLAAVAWRDAAARMRKSGHEIRLGTMDEALAAELMPMLGSLGFRVVARLHEPTKPPIPKDRLLTIGFFGLQRREKGQDFLEELIAACVGEGLRVILHDSSALNTAQGEASGVRRYGFVEDLAALVSAADLVVLPYTPGNYAKKYSGIGGLAISCGIPVLAPAETGIAEMLEDYRTGSTFQDGSVSGILAAILRMRDDYRQYSDSALRAAALWAESNGLARHVADLMGRVP